MSIIALLGELGEGPPGDKSVMLDKAGLSVLPFVERCYPLGQIVRFGVSIPQEFVAFLDAFIEHQRGEVR